jgi:hypothetical protein
VALSAPADGATVAGTVTVSATASDNVGVVGVQFLLDGSPLGAEDTTAPYSVPWNTTGVSQGSHLLSARARDAAGNVTTSATRTVTVPPPDTTSPTVALTAPAGGDTVSGTVTVTATASDDVAVAGVQFLLDGNALGAEDTSEPYSFSWATTGTSNGTHQLAARARDAAGNVTTSAAVSVTVSNTAPTGSPPIAAYSFDAGAGTVATDLSGSGHHGTLVNGPTWVAGRTGTGSALSFDGVNDYVQVSTLPQLPQWTISLWVRSPAAPAATGNSHPIFRGNNFHINWNHPSGTFRGGVALKIGTTWFAASFGPLAANTWYHLAASYDGETLRTYTNGNPVTTNTSPSGPPNTGVTLRLGSNGSAFFAGVIDDVRIYNRALAPNEVVQNMQTPVGP